MSLWGRKRAWELVPAVTYSVGLVHLPGDAALNAGARRPPGALCLGDVTTAVELRLTGSVVHFRVA